MKLPLSWLAEWITCDGDASRVAEALTTRGFYVEGIERHGVEHPGIVVARVLEARKHPNADKLSLCRVDSGHGELSVVCGAPNVRDGMIVPLAPIGTTMPSGLVIKKSKIRGEESQGMLCSARELELSDDHAGIVDLERLLPGAGLEPGRPLDDYLPPPDAVLEIEIPFNRPDGLGVIGLAREVRAALGGRWTDLARARLDARWQGPSAATPTSGLPGAFDLALEDLEGCPRYLAQVVENVTIGPSPTWLQLRLEAVGQRSISNVVDLTNLVLFEFGQPLHAFDLDRLAGPAIRVRRARAGEKLTTLDGRERTLDPEALLICDARRPVAIAGVMGGAETEVSADTRRLLLECAWFEPRRIRRSARTVGLSTEASKRYERGVDPAIGPAAAQRFLTLLLELCPEARTGSGAEQNVWPSTRRSLTLRTTRYARIVGEPVAAGEAVERLTSLEFGAAANDGAIAVEVPPWRHDVTIEDDLVEEVARTRGYDRIPEAALETRGVFARRSPRERLVARAREAMRARGLNEAWSTSLVSEAEAVDAAVLLGDGAERLVRLANPMSRESEMLRPNPVPGLLRACAHNLRNGVAAVRLFEVGVGFRARSAGELPEETAMIAALVTGSRWAHAHDATQKPVDFDDAKGLWEAWLTELSVDTSEWQTYSAPGWKPGASAQVAGSGSRIGWAGTLGLPLLRRWDIEVPARHEVHLFVALLDPLVPQADERRPIRLPGRFPPVSRDLAFFVPLRIDHREVETALAQSGGEWLSTIELFDIYAGPGTPGGMKSLAYAVRFQHPERTLADAEIQGFQDRMVAAVVKQCEGRLREK